MKIALVTIHYANSYGGLLQTYASQKILSRYGDVHILDYANPNLRNTLRAVRWGFKPKDVLRVGKDLIRLLPRKRLTTKFKDFIAKEFRLTNACRSFDELQRESDSFQVVVCGSDQIWNPNIIGSLDRNYFLAFATKSKKISLSSSCGSHVFSPDEQKTVKADLSGFSAIAVREPDTAKSLATLLERSDIACTPDPTLLLSGEDWRKLASPAYDSLQDYILVYTLAKDELVRDAINLVAKVLKKKVVVIDQDVFLGFKADRHIMDASPRDFLSLFKDASFVVTNSFHGTAFSLLFGKPFLTVRPHSGLNRIENLLSKVGEKNRLVTKMDGLDPAKHLDVAVGMRETRLAQLREEGVEYLNRALLGG